MIDSGHPGGGGEGRSDVPVGLTWARQTEAEAEAAKRNRQGDGGRPIGPDGCRRPLLAILAVFVSIVVLGWALTLLAGAWR